MNQNEAAALYQATIMREGSALVADVGEPDPAIGRPRINSAAINLAGQARGWLDVLRKAQPIQSVEEHGQAVGMRKVLGQAKRQLDDIAKSHTAPYRGAIEALRGFFRGPEENIADAIKLVDAAILAFEQAEERRRHEEAERIRRAQAAEAERQRQEAIHLEQLRQQKEAEAKAAAAALEEAGKVDAAAELEQRFALEAALVNEQIMQAAVTAEILETAPVVQAPELARGGTQRREEWIGQVLDMRALVQAWLDGEIPEPALLVNEKLLGQQVRSLKSALKWPGVVVTKRTRIAG